MDWPVIQVEKFHQTLRLQDFFLIRHQLQQQERFTSYVPAREKSASISPPII